MTCKTCGYDKDIVEKRIDDAVATQREEDYVNILKILEKINNPDREAWKAWKEGTIMDFTIKTIKEQGIFSNDKKV